MNNLPIRSREQSLRRWRRRLAQPLLFALLIIAAPAARADYLHQAKQLFRRADAHYKAGRYRDALTLYQRAYQLKPLAGFLFNIGQCYRALGKCQEAVAAFERYLASGNNPRTRKDAKALIADCRSASTEANAPAEQPEQPPDPAPADAPPSTATSPTSAASADHAGSRRLRPLYFWVGVGVSAGLLLASTITWAVSLSNSNAYNDPATPYPQRRGLRDTGEALRTASVVTFALGTAAAVGTTVLYFYTDFSSQEAPRLGAAPLSGGGVLVYGGRF